MIKLVSTLELPAITICPKVSDSFNFQAIYADMKEHIPNLDNHTAIDVLRFFLGGSGFENIEQLKAFNRTYLDNLNQLYIKWKNGYDRKEFFDLIVVIFIYKIKILIVLVKIRLKMWSLIFLL